MWFIFVDAAKNLWLGHHASQNELFKLNRWILLCNFCSSDWKFAALVQFSEKPLMFFFFFFTVILLLLLVVALVIVLFRHFCSFRCGCLYHDILFSSKIKTVLNVDKNK